MIAMTTVTLEQAEAIIGGAIKKARALGLQPMTFAVLDTGGFVVALKREDRCFNFGPDIAIGKAYAAVNMRRSSRDIFENLKNPSLPVAMNSAHRGQFMAGIGALLIVGPNGEVLGAAGGTGDTGDNDELCVRTGIEGAGLRTALK
jgi:uncharacterized protein GlcG (DUF336 family)